MSHRRRQAIHVESAIANITDEHFVLVFFRLAIETNLAFITIPIKSTNLAFEKGRVGIIMIDCMFYNHFVKRRFIALSMEESFAMFTLKKIF